MLGKGTQLQAWTGPWGSRRFRPSEVLDSRHMKVLSLPALRSGRLFPPGDIPRTHFCQRLSRHQRHVAAERIKLIKNPYNPIRNRTRDLPARKTTHMFIALIQYYILYFGWFPSVWIFCVVVLKHFVSSSWSYPQLWRWNSVPKCRYIQFRRRGIARNKEYNIQNRAKVSNQELTHYCFTEQFSVWDGWKLWRVKDMRNVCEITVENS